MAVMSPITHIHTRTRRNDACSTCIRASSPTQLSRFQPLSLPAIDHPVTSHFNQTNEVQGHIVLPENGGQPE
jgi:hypothetical protein